MARELETLVSIASDKAIKARERIAATREIRSIIERVAGAQGALRQTTFSAERNGQRVEVRGHQVNAPKEPPLLSDAARAAEIIDQIPAQLEATYVEENGEVTEIHGGLSRRPSADAREFNLSGRGGADTDGGDSSSEHSGGYFGGGDRDED
jgi:hypothetical protein